MPTIGKVIWEKRVKNKPDNTFDSSKYVTRKALLKHTTVNKIGDDEIFYEFLMENIPLDDKGNEKREFISKKSIYFDYLDMLELINIISSQNKGLTNG